MRRTGILAFLALVLSACAPAPVAQDDGGRRPSAAGDEAGAPRSATTALVAQSRSQIAAGEYPQAAASIERALRIEPADPYLWIELARIHLAAGDVRQAEANARKALSLAGDDAAARRAAEQVLETATHR